jgi:hypothetical protein
MRASPLPMRVHARDSLLVPCSENKFSIFGQNSLVLGASPKNSLLFSLLLDNLADRKGGDGPLLCLLPLRIQYLLRSLSLSKVLAHCRQKRLRSLRRPYGAVEDISEANISSVEGARITRILVYPASL